MRGFSFYLFWILCLFALVGDVMSTIFAEDDSDPMFFINSLFYLSMLCVVILVDLHYCTVISYHAQFHIKRIAKEKKKEAKK
jgi:hypothetical protein